MNLEQTPTSWTSPAWSPVEHPRRPAPPATWRLGTDHLVAVIPDEVVRSFLPDQHPDADPRLPASAAAGHLTPHAVLAWWFRDADPAAYGHLYVPHIQPETAQVFALGELERMLDVIPNATPGTPVPCVARRLEEHVPEDRVLPHTVLVIHWLDVLAFIWAQLVAPVMWRDDPRPNAPADEPNI